MNRIHFHKYHGTGNDFLLIDDRSGNFEAGREIIGRMCDRHFGIGADGLIMIMNANGFAFRMRYFNSDGMESSMCGNGGRCAVAFADFLSDSGDKIRFLAHDGPHEGLILSGKDPEYTVRLQMSDAGPVRVSHGGHFIDTGSPHLVIQDGKVRDLDIVQAARPLRYHPDFLPGGTNVDFMTENHEGIYVRSYERGVEDETLSCGTGATASALVYARLKGLQTGNIPVETRGGNLRVSFTSQGVIFTDIWLEGPAVRICEGDFVY